MNSILKNTHKKENVDLLKVRDYYFDKARNYNVIKTLLLYIPPILLVASYFLPIVQFNWIDKYRDYIINTISILAFILMHYHLDNIINHNLYISNTFREKYDCNVFEIEPNIFSYLIEDENMYSEKSRFVKDFDKYEVWYGEVFCNKNSRNVLCCQMDNIIYTYYVYKHYKKVKTALFILIIALITILSFIFNQEGLLLGLMSIFNIIQVYIEDKSKIEELIQSNSDTMKIVKNNFQQIISELDNGNTSILRMLQDTIINNRNQSIFIPKYVRNKYLRNDSFYYKKLDEYKALYFEEESTCIPSTEEDIEVFDLEEEGLITLTQVHRRLILMMEKVLDVFEKENITYTLDGGTLLGAMRKQKFIFWDDDIDIAIPIVGGMLERAKEAITKHLSDQFDIQDYKNDPFYSPRLSNFRIRDRKSKITEKDSPLFDRYLYNGLFIDVYAYSPVVFNVMVDKLYRRLRIHPLYKSIQKTEQIYSKYSHSDKTEDREKLQKILNKFQRQKNAYMRRVKWYQTHAKNENYFVYVPNYIENLCSPGPYIRKGDLYGTTQNKSFETLTPRIPSNPEKVLSAYYNNWKESPYKSIDTLKSIYNQNWYSHHRFMSTVLKHIDHVDLF